MKRLCALSAILLLLTGCGAQTQISELAFATVIGVDADETGLIVSAAVLLPHREEGEQTKILSVSCASLAEGLVLLDAQSPDTVFFGHVTAVLFGEEAARAGIRAEMDCLVRSPRFRLDLLLCTVKGGTAQGVLNAQSEQTPPPGETIMRLFHAAPETSVSGSVYLSQAADKLADPYSEMFLPYLTGDALCPAGYALFRSDRLIGFLDERLSLGLNFLTNRIERAVVKTDQATLRVNGCRTRMTLRDGVFYVGAQVKWETLDTVDDAAGGAGEILCALMDDTVRRLKTLSCDAAGFGDCFLRSGGTLTKPWQSVFAQITVECQVTMKRDGDKTRGGEGSEPVAER